MISSTFSDLEKHRTALIRAIKGQGLTDVAMENDSAKPDVDVIDSSLQMVRDASAYVGVISRKYGQTPVCAQRNPKGLSLTELEFEEAQRLGRPILLFIMGEQHPLREVDFEADAAKREKLTSFRERAKKMSSDSQVHRVYATFESLEDFTTKAIHSVAKLRDHLERVNATPESTPIATFAPGDTETDPIPTAPDFYAEPPYIGSHQFFGRQAQLDVLNDWALPADPHPVLLFDAIGGSGKSMLTWEWTTKHALHVRDDWAGRFWYSFYERGAVMADFCRRALAYITGEPFEKLVKIKTPQLADRLLHHLQDRPWLLVLDGLERVLVAYHRFDAAQVPDNEIDQATDSIAQRDPCAAIRPEDDDLLRSLAAAAPSKLLVTSRLLPRVLLNASNQPIPGVQRVSLPGLRPPEAEELIRSCGVTGTSEKIQDYLKRNCDCHPLVTGVLAGLVNDYLPDKGNFDAWMADSAGGGRLDLVDLDLVQRRNHILRAGLDALPERSRDLLSTLALLSEAADYAILSALNPHVPPEPEVKEPDDPQLLPWWDSLSEDQKDQLLQDYATKRQRSQDYERTVVERRETSDDALEKLVETVRDLERRGLLEYSPLTKRYDIHPVVRGIAAGSLRADETARYGQRVVDHFSQKAHDPYREAETWQDVQAGLQVVRTYLKMGRHQEASRAYVGDLSSALFFNLEAHVEVLPLLQPFFPNGWGMLPGTVQGHIPGYLANDAALALIQVGQLEEGLELLGILLRFNANRHEFANVVISLNNLSFAFRRLKRLAASDRALRLSNALATAAAFQPGLFKGRLNRYQLLVNIGRWDQAESTWRELTAMGRDWEWAIYRPGDAELAEATLRFRKGELSEEHLTEAERSARVARNRGAIRGILELRGLWRFEQREWSLAADAFHESARMAREIGETSWAAETYLALARLHLEEQSDAIVEAERLAKASRPAHDALAQLWLALGERERAKEHALAGYREAWADGEPYVFRYELDKARALLTELGVPIPRLPPYDPAKDERFPWEDAVEAAIEELRAKEAEPGET